MSAIVDILVKAISEVPVASVLRERLELAKERAEHLERHVTELKDQITELKDQVRNKDDTRWKQLIEDVKALLNEEIEVLRRRLENKDIQIDQMTSEAEQRRRAEDIYRLVYERMSGGMVTTYDTFNAGCDESKAHS